MPDTKDSSSDPPPYSEFPVCPRPYVQSLSPQTHPPPSRTNHLVKTIKTLIDPVIKRRLSHGLNNTTIALLLNTTPQPSFPAQSPSSFPFPFSYPSFPSSSATTNPNPNPNPNPNHTITFPHQPPQIVGLASEDPYDVKIQLEHDLDTVAFWSRGDVIHEFDTLLRRRSTRLTVVDDAKKGSRHEDGDEYGVAAYAFDTRTSKNEYRDRELRSGLHPEDTTSSTRESFRSSRNAAPSRSRTEANMSVETKTKSDMPATSSSTDETQVNVKLDELCFRTVSSFGLYETVTKPAVVVCVRVSG